MPFVRAFFIYLKNVPFVKSRRCRKLPAIKLAEGKHTRPFFTRIYVVTLEARTGMQIRDIVSDC